MAGKVAKIGAAQLLGYASRYRCFKLSVEGYVA